MGWRFLRSERIKINRGLPLFSLRAPSERREKSKPGICAVGNWYLQAGVVYRVVGNPRAGGGVLFDGLNILRCYEYRGKI